MTAITTTFRFFSAPPFTTRPPILNTTTPPFSFLNFKPISYHFPKPFKTQITMFIPKAEGDDAGGGSYDYYVNEGGIEDVDNKKDYDLEYDSLAAVAHDGGGEDLAMDYSKGFMSTKGWGGEKIVDYRIDEDEFHKISLSDCDFFIRKPPDPDNDLYDFREMYITPPDTDVYAIPNVLAPMPQKSIRCAISDFGWYNVTEPTVDRLRDPLYKSEKEIFKVFLTKHYKNRRLHDREFVLDFEEIYVIDSKTKSITRAKVVVTIPEGRNRDRRFDLLVISDNGTSFKIIHGSRREDPTTVIEKRDWAKTSYDMEKFLIKQKDFDVSNWF